MRHITTLLAVSTLILALTSANLYLQLASARDRAQRDAASEGERCSQDASLEQIREGLEMALRPSSAGQHPTAQPRSATETPSASLSRAPEMSDELRQEHTRRLYRSILRELALSDAEVAAVLPVLVQQELRANKPFAKGLPRQEDPQRDQSELAAVLGAEKAERLIALRKLRPARSEVSMLRRRLEDTDEPLSAEQQEALLGILATKISDSARQRVEGHPFDWMREREQRLRQEAAPVLTAAQRRLLEEDDAFQNAMRMRAEGLVAPQAGSSAPALRPAFRTINDPAELPSVPIRPSSDAR